MEPFNEYFNFPDSERLLKCLNKHNLVHARAITERTHPDQSLHSRIAKNFGGKNLAEAYGDQTTAALGIKYLLRIQLYEEAPHFNSPELVINYFQALKDCSRFPDSNS